MKKPGAQQNSSLNEDERRNDKISGGNTMSTTTAARRIALLASSSVGLAVVASAASVTLALAPTAAQAQTCTTTTMSGPGPAVTCGFWRPPVGSSTVSSGITSVTITENGAMVAGTVLNNSQTVEQPTIVTFGNPAVVIQNNGVLVVGPHNTNSANGLRVDVQEAELRLVGVNEFRNAGVVLLGGFEGGVGGTRVNGVRVDITDGWYDDVLSLPGATWTSEGGEIVFDVNLEGRQANCVDRAPTDGTFERSNPVGNLGAADCLRLVGGATEGVTNLTVNAVFPGDLGRFNEEGILLVDVGGGESAQGHFVISPNSDDYSSAYGGSVDKGFVQYVLGYNEDTQQHRLYGILSGASHQLPMVATAAQNIWRTSTGSWFDRQSELRGRFGEGLGGGIWLRGAAEFADRDVTNVSSGGGVEFSLDNTHQQSTYAITGGLDLISTREGQRAFVAGLMAGYAHSELDYAVSPNVQRFDAWVGGAYASFIAGGFFVDAVVNTNLIILDNDAPAFAFTPDETIMSSRALSIGGQVETGYRFTLADGFFVEPLAAVSYIKTTYDDLEVKPDDPLRPGFLIRYDDPSSLRAGIGGRIGADRDLNGVRTQFSLLGRMWNDLESENVAVIHNLAYPNDPDVRVVDDFGGELSEFSVGASVLSPDGAVAGFLNFGGKFADDYSAKNGSLGVRVAW